MNSLDIERLRELQHGEKYKNSYKQMDLINARKEKERLMMEEDIDTTM